MSADILHELVGPFSGLLSLNNKITPVCIRSGLQTPNLIRGTTIRRYTDASWTPNGSSIGILTIHTQGDNSYAVLQAQPFGAGAFSDNNDAETYGIAIAGRIAIINGDEDSTIITDSAVGIRRTEKSIRSAQQMRDIIDDAPNEIDLMTDEVLRAGINVQIVHTYGHKRNAGNLIADLLAKQAMQTGQQIFLVLTIPQLQAWIEVQFRNILSGSRDVEVQRKLRGW